MQTAATPAETTPSGTRRSGPFAARTITAAARQPVPDTPPSPAWPDQTRPEGPCRKALTIAETNDCLTLAAWSHHRARLRQRTES